ncbi:MAG: DUF484 family protein [Betaproteobacteria bacterium]|nr:DUF484 family protein [Betaproteobacteria bacterium]
MNADEVARYLKDNPIFFEDYAEMLSQITVPHPHGGHAIALSDRQVLALREKNRALETKMAELIQFGEENDAISNKMHRLCAALLPAADLAAMLAVLFYNLREDFAVPYATVRLWRGGALGMEEFTAVSEDVKRYAAGLARPYCGPSGNIEIASWFGEAAPHVRSVSFMPLADTGTGGCDAFGLLALGSEDLLRFYPEMGTVYLVRLGELVSAALARWI